MKYDNIIKAICLSCKPVKRGEYIYNIRDGALYRTEAWVPNDDYIDWKYLRQI